MLMIVNLNLMITRNCNFKCKHCLRGESANQDISDDVLNKIFKPGTIIQLLQLNGGEVFSKPHLLSKIIDLIIKNNVIITAVSIPSNGTLFTSRIEKELDRLNLYIARCNMLCGMKNNVNIAVDISRDEYHITELKRIEKENPKLYSEYVTNIGRLINSKYFSGVRELHTIINAGRAKELDVKKNESIRYNIYYCEFNMPLGRVLEVSTLGIDINGTVCNTCGEMPPKGSDIYGNIMKESIDCVVKRVGIRCFNEINLADRHQSDVLRNVSAMGGSMQVFLK